MSHTKEPWSVRERGDYGFGPEADLSVEKENSQRGYMSLGDARRAVACVNACAGIPTDRLEEEGSAVMGWQRTARKLIDVSKQRDELLAILEGISKQTPEKPDYWSSCSQCERNISEAEEAIASVKGGAA